jgi:hypothetical protein
MSKKVSRTLKVFCYVCLNLSSLLLLAMKAIEDPSFRTILVGLASLAFMNFLFSVMFRMKDKEQM